MDPQTIDLVLEKASRKPLPLDPRRLMQHAAIFAQSGSGKSFMLGRLIEELAVKTSASIVILDPNSDFIRLKTAQPDVWKNKNIKPWFYPMDTYKAFFEVWKNVSVLVASNRNLKQALPLVLDWGSLDISEMAAITNIDQRRDSDLYWCLFLSSQIAQQTWEADEPYYDFSHFSNASENVIGYLTSGRGAQLIRDNPLAKTLRRATSAHVALRFRAVVAALAEYAIWRSYGDGAQDIRALIDGDQAPQVLVVDLQSLETDEERATIASSILGALWRTARAQQWMATRDILEKDVRVPTFLVIDEAHNLVPAQKENETIRRVADQIVRIAAEGRKFALYLVVATQRPRKVDPNALSECDNLMIMKMRNQVDLEYVGRLAGLANPTPLEKARKLSLGDILLFGEVGDSTEILHVAPRRTVEGGKGVSKSHWLQR